MANREDNDTRYSGEKRSIKEFLGDPTRRREGMENLARYAAMREKENYQGGNPFNQFIEDEKRGRMSPNKLDREKNKLRRDIALRKNFIKSGRRENEEDLLSRDDGTFQGFLNNFPTLRSQANVVGRQVAKQKQEAALEAAKDDRVKVTKENAEAMQRGVGPELASAAKEQDSILRAEEYKKFSDEAKLNAQEKRRARDPQIVESSSGGLEGLGTEALPVVQAMERAKEREAEELTMNLKKQDFLSNRTASQLQNGRSDQVELGVEKRGQLPPSLRDTLNSPEIAGEKLNLNDPENRELLGKIAPELAASMNMGDVENQISEGMGKDEEARAVNEDLQGLSPIAQLDEDEQKEVLKEVAKASPDGKQSEEYLAAKEDTGDYIRYADGKFVLNKRAIRQDFQRKRNMDMLKDIPVANRAAMMASWGYIDSDDLSLAQKQSAKEIKEMSLLDLKLNKAKTDAEKAKNSLSDEDKVSFNLAQRGMQDAFTKGDYEAAEMYADQIKKIVPTYDNSSFTKLAEKRIQKNKEVTPMKLFKKYGLKDGIGYYKSRDSIVKTLSTLKEKGSGGLDALLGTAAPNGNGTYADLLKNHGIYSWDKIAQDIVQGRPPAGVPKQYLKDEESYMGWALPEIKSKLLSEMYGPLHGEIEAFHSPKMIKDRAVKRFKSTKDYSNPLGVSAEKVTPKKPAEVIKKVEASKSKKSASIEALNYQDKGVLSTRKQRVKETTNTIKKLEKELAGIKGSLNSSQIKTKQKRIDSFKNDLKKYEKSVIDKEAEAKHTNAEKIKGMKEYNKKRKAAGFPWLRKADYIRLKEEGKL